MLRLTFDGVRPQLSSNYVEKQFKTDRETNASFSRAEVVKNPKADTVAVIFTVDIFESIQVA